MNSIKTALTVLAAILVGVALGASLSRPPQVKAIGSALYINVQKVQEGNNVKSPLTGSTYIGFSCTQTDCYVASTE